MKQKFLVNETILEFDEKRETVSMEQIDENIWMVRSGKKIHRVAISTNGNGLIQISNQGLFFEGKKLSLREELKEKLAAQEDQDHSRVEVKSPMPGTVLRIVKSPNEEVHKGETIVIVEAMKMENEIKSPMDGWIETIAITEGQAVVNKQLLYIVTKDLDEK